MLGYYGKLNFLAENLNDGHMGINKKYTFILLVFFSGNANAWSYLEEIESQVYRTPGSKQQITLKGKNCITQIVSNDSVKVSTGNSIFQNASDTSSQIQGGSVIINTDLNNGLVIANNRVDFTSTLLSHSAKSKITFLAKPGRFRIRHTGIKQVQRRSGNMPAGGYRKVHTSFGGGHKKVKSTLETVSLKIANCVKETGKSNNW